MKRIAPLTIAACAFALSFALATPADADGRRGRHNQQDRHRVEQRHRDNDRYRGDRHHVDRNRDRYRAPYRDHRRVERRHHRRHQRVDIPRHISRQHYGNFRPYFDSHVWFAPHGHRHASYYFPVVIDGYRTSRRHDYCDGELFRPHGSVGYGGRNWGIRVDF